METEYFCTMSMGVVRFPKDANTVTDLIKKADISLYEAKKGGKNRVEYYGGDGEDTASRRLDMEKNMLNGCQLLYVFINNILKSLLMRMWELIMNVLMHAQEVF